MGIPDLAPLWISLRVALVATLITVVLGTTIAYPMAHYRGLYRSWIDGILLLPLVLPPTVVGFVLLILMGNQGVIGKVLAHWQIRLIFTWYAAVLAAVVIAFPLMYRAMVAAFSQMDPSILEAARLDGASEWQVFWAMALPLAQPGLVAGSVLAFCRALGEFGATLMVAGNIPGSTQTLPMAIYFAVEGRSIPEAWFWVGIIVMVSWLSILVINGWMPFGEVQERSGSSLKSL